MVDVREKLEGLSWFWNRLCLPKTVKAISRVIVTETDFPLLSSGFDVPQSINEIDQSENF